MNQVAFKWPCLEGTESDSIAHAVASCAGYENGGFFLTAGTDGPIVPLSCSLPDGMVLNLHPTKKKQPNLVASQENNDKMKAVDVEGGAQPSSSTSAPDDDTHQNLLQKTKHTIMDMHIAHNFHNWNEKYPFLKQYGHIQALFYFNQL